MPRNLQFDQESALDLALDQFWVHGFNDTSMRDLAGQLGVSLSSLYNTFGGKRELFLTVLGRYGSHYLSARLDALEQDHSPLEAIRELFRGIVEDSLSDPIRKGCFLVNTALELSPHDEGIGAKVRDQLDAMEAFLTRALRRAKKDGTLSINTRVAPLASHLMASLLGIRVLARANPAPSKLRQIVEGALSPLKTNATHHPKGST